VDLQAAAQRVMLENGFELVVSPGASRQLADLERHPPLVAPGADVRDLRGLLWSSIDNDTSRDLDQIEVAERLSDGTTRVMVAIADVDAFVPKGSPIDQDAARQTTTVYTGVRNFPMLPEPLSTAATSLLEAADKLAVVIEFVVGTNGHVQSSTLYRAAVRNAAQLTYNAIGRWLEGSGPPPPKVAASPDLQAQLRLQDAAARRSGTSAIDMAPSISRPSKPGRSC